MLNEFIYRAGTLAHNHKINDTYAFLKQSEKWDLNALEEYQFKKLTDLLHHAYKYSSYYRDKFDAAKVRLGDIRTLHDIRRIPATTKDELLKNVGGIQIRNGSERLYYSETSGSSGTPLVFYRNQDWDAWHRASVYRGYSWYGVEPWERNGYLWGYNIALKRRLKIRFLDALQNRFRLFSYKDDEIDAFVHKLKDAAFLSGYSSMVYEIAKRINERGLNKEFNLKMVKGTSEKIYDSYRIEVERAFNRKLTSEYGAAEAGIIAFECPMGNMHMNMETVIAEEEDHEIVVTNLVSRSFPIIRYKLGDYVDLDLDTRCPCGMAHRIVKEVTGRVGKVIHGLKHQYPSLTLYYVFKNLAMEYNVILNYRATQHEKGHLQMELENALQKDQKVLLIQEFEKYFTDDVKLEIRDSVALHDHNRKKVDFISEL